MKVSRYATVTIQQICQWVGIEQKMATRQSLKIALTRACLLLFWSY